MTSNIRIKKNSKPIDHSNISIGEIIRILDDNQYVKGKGRVQYKKNILVLFQSLFTNYLNLGYNFLSDFAFKNENESLFRKKKL